ncbi:MAG: hypothetical protein EF813_03390 [Methanosarcinales archaeon]|nr:MAG: hypothetical protein EF813_03390 [Methanosarcinales archaeon]
MNRTTKPKRFGIAAMLTMLLLIVIISVAGASGDDYSAENFYVDEDTAWMYADVCLTEWVADETPGLGGWDCAKVQKGAVTIYDIHGTKLFYEFTVTSDGKAIGGMEIAASKVLGSSLRRVLLSPPLDRETAAQKAIEVAEKEYPDYKIQYTKSVCYSYSKQGVMVTLAKPGAKEEQTVIVDPYTSSMGIPSKSEGNSKKYKYTESSMTMLLLSSVKQRIAIPIVLSQYSIDRILYTRRVKVVSFQYF